MTDDAELLRQYEQSGSETAFADLVSRYLPLVYAAARRLVGDPGLTDADRIRHVGIRSG